MLALLLKIILLTNIDFDENFVIKKIYDYSSEENFELFDNTFIEKNVKKQLNIKFNIIKKIPLKNFMSSCHVKNFVLSYLVMLIEHD